MTAAILTMPMFRFLKEIYLTGFTIFFRVGGANWTTDINIGKGVAGVAMVEWVILIGIAAWIDVLVGAKSLLDLSKWKVVVAFLVLCFANRYLLVSCGHGIRFEREFTNIGKSRKFLLVASFLLLLLSATAFFIHWAQAHRQLMGVAH